MNKQALAVAAAGVAASVFSGTAFAQTTSFPDVPANHWAAKSVAALAKSGVVSGTSTPLAFGAPQKGTKPKYDGNKPVTRYELAVTLYRFVQVMDQVAKQPKSNTGAMTTPKDGDAALKSLVARGYLKANSPLVTKSKVAGAGAKAATSDEFAAALGDVLTKIQEGRTPVSKGSLKDIEIPSGMHSH